MIKRIKDLAGLNIVSMWIDARRVDIHYVTPPGKVGYFSIDHSGFKRELHGGLNMPGQLIIHAEHEHRVIKGVEDKNVYRIDTEHDQFTATFTRSLEGGNNE